MIVISLKLKLIVCPVYIMFTTVTTNLINSLFFVLFIIFNGEIDNLSYILLLYSVGIYLNYYLHILIDM